MYVCYIQLVNFQTLQTRKIWENETYFHYLSERLQLLHSCAVLNFPTFPKIFKLSELICSLFSPNKQIYPGLCRGPKPSSPVDDEVVHGFASELLAATCSVILEIESSLNYGGDARYFTGKRDSSHSWSTSKQKPQFQMINVGQYSFLNPFLRKRNKTWKIRHGYKSIVVLDGIKNNQK